MGRTHALAIEWGRAPGTLPLDPPMSSECRSLKDILHWCLFIQNNFSENLSRSMIFVTFSNLTLSPLNNFSSANFLVCFNFQNATLFLKVGESLVFV